MPRAAGAHLQTGLATALQGIAGRPEGTVSLVPLADPGPSHGAVVPVVMCLLVAWAVIVATHVH